eukprot:m.12963 g.12963  ORF g.12963 m.12963 type:complete len:152 (+) comp24411_c0_seq1:309-764(+)
MGLVDPVRLCKKCQAKAKKDNHFVSHQLKSLTKGACFSLSEVEGFTFRCHLSGDHREILFDGDTACTRDPIQLHQIIEVKNSNESDCSSQEGLQSSPPISSLVGLILTYKDGKEERKIELNTKCVLEEEVKVSQEWLLMLKKALKVLHEKW